MHFGFINVPVILLHSDYRHVSATHVAIFRMVRAVKNCGVIPTGYKYIHILSLSPEDGPISGRNILVVTMK